MKDKCRKEKAFTNIGLKSCVSVVIILLVVLAISGALSYFIPQGSFETAVDADGNDKIIPGTYHSDGVIDGIAIWRVITAPVRVFFTGDWLNIVMISVFLLVMSGVFNLLEKTNGIKVLIGRIMRKLKDKGAPVVCLSVLVFMLFGSFFGMFEELTTLIPIMVMFALSMGMDTMTGVGACMLAACFGFSAAITNPFSVGLVAQEAGVGPLEGVWLRIVFFAIIYAIVCVFLMLHLRKIERDPTSSPTYEADLEKKAKLEEMPAEKIENSDRIFRTYAIFFIAQMLVLILVASVRAISGLAIPILAVSFLVGGIIAGLSVTERKSDTFRYMLKGAAAMLPAVLMIALASSVSLVLAESGILHTIMNSVIVLLDGKSKFFCVLLIYFLILFLQLFIGSASAKIRLVMPIVMPICAALGISPAIVILAYCMADGFTDVIIPTNPVLLVGLSMANTTYGKWVRWTWKLQLIVFALTIGVLYFACAIGY
ncbi:MAG: YfcC family protein [Clostridia bacterium]|nr:YfcC family protein [Clostridia bacterium]